MKESTLTDFLDEVPSDDDAVDASAASGGAAGDEAGTEVSDLDGSDASGGPDGEDGSDAFDGSDPVDDAPDSVTVTYAWGPDRRCADCEAETDRLWCGADGLVCGECKEW